MGLVRDSSKVLSVLKELDGKQIITKVNCRIQVPVRYMSIELGQIGVDTYTLGCLAIILEDDTYAVLNVNALLALDPYKTITTKVDDVEYYEFYFTAGDVVFKDTTVIKREDIMFAIFNEFVFKGKIPWYMGYEDLGKLFDTSSEYAGSSIANSPETIEFIASMLTRGKDNRDKYLRSIIRSYKETTNDKIAYVPLMSVFYSVHNTVNRLAGSYFDNGITSSLVNPTDKVGSIEKILRA